MIDHLSFSSIETWDKCRFKFKLKYIDKIPVDRGNIYSVFGTAIHLVLKKILTKELPQIEDEVRTSFINDFKQNLKDLPAKQKLKITKDSKINETVKNMFQTGAKLALAMIEELKKNFLMAMN